MATGIPLDTPASVKREVRREVNFGCPYPGCGSPYLTYNHFDPPRRVRLHHEPSGMIALCWPHHQSYESGAITIEQLRDMKARPYLAGPPVRGRFEGWNRRRVVIRIGSDWFFNPAYVLQVGGRVLVGVSEVADYGGLDLDVRGADGQPLLQMVANDWDLETLPADLVVSNRYNHLVVDLARERIQFESLFRSFSQEEFLVFLEETELLANKSDVLASVGGWPIALCTVVGTFVWPSRVTISERYVFGEKNRLLFEGNVSRSGRGIFIP